MKCMYLASIEVIVEQRFAAISYLTQMLCIAYVVQTRKESRIAVRWGC